MENWYKEEYNFMITVVSVGKDGNPHRCRNGHEVGDVYSCGYGCPMPQNGEGGFCSKSMSRLFTLQEVVRSGGDLSKLQPKAEKHKGNFRCPNGVVSFSLEATIKSVQI